MKTAMQELLEWITDPTIDSNKDKDNAIGKIYSLLEKEKQQIIDAFTAANTIDQQGTIDAEQYYNDTFNPNKKATV